MTSAESAEERARRHVRILADAGFSADELEGLARVLQFAAVIANTGEANTISIRTKWTPAQKEAIAQITREELEIGLDR